jgi:hypothetical protein
MSEIKLPKYVVRQNIAFTLKANGDKICLVPVKEGTNANRIQV